MTAQLPIDVFISYSHSDAAWAAQFHEHLRARLTELLGVEPVIWRDQLSAEGVLGDESENALKQSKVLVCVLSPGYVRSERCLAELAVFCQSAEAGGGLIVGNRSRVFKVVRLRVPFARHPPQLQRFIGYEFFEYADACGRTEEFRPGLTPTRDNRYWKMLDDLAYHVTRMLETVGREPAAHESSGAASPRDTVLGDGPMEASKPGEPGESGGPETPPVTAPEGTGESVFFCYDRDDTEFALKLATRLKDRGVRIWLDQWDIPESADWDRSIDEALYGCSRFLIVLSPASVTSDEVRAELRIALDEKKAIIPILYRKCMVPRRLRLIQHFDFTARAPDDETMTERLVRSLTAGKR